MNRPRPGTKPARRPRGATPSRPAPAERARASALFEALAKAYPDAHCELEFSSPHELLIATILSAQATDVSVNKATPALFRRFPTPADYARATPQEIEPFIRTIGLFRSKARAVHESMRSVVENFGGRVPRTIDELLTLRGVARKTANVVLSNAFHTHEGVVVDTHVQRLSVRFGLCRPEDTVGAIERRLMALFPREHWGQLSHLLIFHGRRACKARGVACPPHEICARFGDCCELRISAPTKRSTRSSPAAKAARARPRKASGARRGANGSEFQA